MTTSDDRLDALQGQMVLLRHDLRQRRNRTLAWRAFCLLVALGFLWALVDSRHQTAEIVTSRTESRIARCEADNDFAAKHNKLTREGVKTFDLILENPAASEAGKAFAAERKAGYEQSIVPLRDCSPEAVRRFYEGK